MVNKRKLNISVQLIFLITLLSACVQSVKTKDAQKFVEGISLGMPAIEIQEAIDLHFPDRNVDVFDDEEVVLWTTIGFACGQRNACMPNNLKEILNKRAYPAEGTRATDLVPGVLIHTELGFGEGFDDISMLAVFLDENKENVIGYVTSGRFLTD